MQSVNLVYPQMLNAYKHIINFDTDINGGEMRYTYDNRGRLTSVSAPYEIEAGGQATISIEYDDKNHIAKMTNYDAKTQNTIITYLFTNDLGRAIQTKKSGVVDGKEVMIASGVVKFDAFGRKIAEGQPVTDNTVALNTDDILNSTLTEYDAQDRPVKVTIQYGLFRMQWHCSMCCIGGV